VKYKNKKQGEFDSLAEKTFYFRILSNLEKTGKIRDLKRLDNKKDYFILVDNFKINKNNKISKQSNIKYTPDFYFYNINSNFFPYLPDGKKVYCEFKSKITEKKTDYRIRRKMFVKTLDANTIFLEVISTNKRLEYVVWGKL
jgi:hypothetical protein